MASGEITVLTRRLHVLIFDFWINVTDHMVGAD